MGYSEFKPETSDADPIEVKERLIEFLREFDAETEEIVRKLKFTREHNFHHEAEFLREKVDGRGSVFVQICNKVLGVYY